MHTLLNLVAKARTRSLPLAVLYPPLVAHSFALRHASMTDARIDFDALPWTQAADGLRFKSMERCGRRVRLLEFATGFVEGEWCLKSHAGYVVTGEFEIEFADRTERVAAGDALVIEGEPHRARAGREGARLFLVEDA